ncbi:predicted protein [Histoplasma capsulatum H143]|uniref:Uncharacterized protein n=1 Tax=Ajellomyces capsulatus (strain H143) TaxID=544712 RepID=C6HPW6_AJECH|nr:predicted protein [Histoplasma capsulatum H143]
MHSQPPLESLPRPEERGSISSAALDKPAEGRRMSPRRIVKGHRQALASVDLLKRHGYRGTSTNRGWAANPLERTESSLLSDEPRTLYPTFVTSWNEEFGVRHTE